MSTEPAQRYQIRFQPAARRAIAQRLPETVAAAVLEFCEAALAVNPHRVGKPLFGPLAGCHGARRGTYRIVYRIDETPAPSTSSTSTTAPRSTTARTPDHRREERLIVGHLSSGRIAVEDGLYREQERRCPIVSSRVPRCQRRRD